MKKVSTVAAKASKGISQKKFTVGLDLGDRNSWYCVVDVGIAPTIFSSETATHDNGQSSSLNFRISCLIGPPEADSEQPLPPPHLSVADEDECSRDLSPFEPDLASIAVDFSW